MVYSGLVYSHSLSDPYSDRLDKYLCCCIIMSEHQSILDMGQRYGKQLIWMIAGLILAIIVLSVDSKFYVIFSYHFYLITIGLLVLVLIFGREVNGARAWV